MPFRTREALTIQPKVTTAALGGAVATVVIVALESGGVEVTPELAAAIATFAAAICGWLGPKGDPAPLALEPTMHEWTPPSATDPTAVAALRDLRDSIDAQTAIAEMVAAATSPVAAASRPNPDAMRDPDLDDPAHDDEDDEPALTEEDLAGRDEGSVPLEDHTRDAKDPA